MEGKEDGDPGEGAEGGPHHDVKLSQTVPPESRTDGREVSKPIRIVLKPCPVAGFGRSCMTFRMAFSTPEYFTQCGVETLKGFTLQGKEGAEKGDQVGRLCSALPGLAP